MVKTKKQMFIVITIFALIIFLGGTAYAWFTYQRESSVQKLITGNVYLVLENGMDSISLTNIFPETPEEARSRNDNSITFEISGINESNKTMYYEIDLNHGIDKESPYVRFDDEDLRFDLVELDSNGNEVKYLLSNVGYDSLVNKRIYADKVSGNSSTEVSRKYKLRMWLSDTVLISDSDPNRDYTAVGYSNHYTNIKVVVIGDFIDKSNIAFYSIKKNTDTVTQIDFGNISSASNGEGLYVLPGTENDDYPIYYYRGNIDNNNVIFAGFCWQMIRTTDTGGIKMIYNGTVTGNGETCENSLHEDRVISGTRSFSHSSSLSRIGYMDNPAYLSSEEEDETGLIYGKDIEWNGTNYLVIENTSGSPSSNITKDNNHHYSCGTNGTTTCSTVRYYYYENYYITISSGDLLDDVIYKMTGNGTETTKQRNASYNINLNASFIKDAVDKWFKNNLTNIVDTNNQDYRDYLEDTVYCNDRSFKTVDGYLYNSTYLQSGWNPHGGSLARVVSYGTANRVNNDNWYSTTNVPSISCPNESDRFTISESNGNGALSYPVALITADEIVMAGASGNNSTSNELFYLYTGGDYWSMSPDIVARDNADGFIVDSTGRLKSVYIGNAYNVRPVISLKFGTEFAVSGDGTPTNPYVVKYD